MSAPACSTHPRLPARDACGRCERAVCLACAIPFRGEVRCRECAHHEVGAPVEPPPASVGRRGLVDVAAGGLFLAAAVVSLLPWDRQGERDAFLSAWSFRPDPWPLFAGLLLLSAAVLSLRSGGAIRPLRAAAVSVGILAILATIVALPAPALSTRGPVPLLVLLLGIAATLTGAFGARHARELRSAP